MERILSTREKYLNWPNYLSFFRVGLIPVVSILMGFQHPVGSGKFNSILGYLTAIFFVISGISDVVDGYLARRMKLTSTFGKFLDPLADKLLHMAVLVMLVALGEIPGWIVIILLFREFAVTALRAIAAGEGVILAADVWGKKKTVLLNVALTCFLLPTRFLDLSTRAVGWVFLLLALAVSLGSGSNYGWGFYQKIRTKRSTA